MACRTCLRRSRHVKPAVECPVSALAKHAGISLMITIGIRIAAVLDPLCHRGDVRCFPVVDLDQRVVELFGGVVGIEQLLAATPALGWSLLEQADRIEVAVVKVPDAGFLVDRGHGDGGSPGRKAALHRRPHDDRRVVRLLQIECDGVAVGGRDTALLAGDGGGQASAAQPQERAYSQSRPSTPPRVPGIPPLGPSGLPWASSRATLR